MFKKVFMSMVLLRYDQFIKKENEVEIEPEGFNIKHDWTGDDGGKHKHGKKFLEDYEITNNEMDYVVSKVMETWLESKNFGISYILFTKELNAYCGKHHFDSVKSKVERLLEKHHRCGLEFGKGHIVQKKRMKPMRLSL